MTDPILLTATTVRKNADVSLREISERTKISMRNLEAIENGEFTRLPGGVYATSYIRQYARAIGYDEFELLGLYHRVTGAPQSIPQLDQVQNPSSPGFRPMFQY